MNTKTFMAGLLVSTTGLVAAGSAGSEIYSKTHSTPAYSEGCGVIVSGQSLEDYKPCGAAEASYTKAETPVYTKAETPVYTKAETPVYTKAETPVYTKAETPVYTKAGPSSNTEIEDVYVEEPAYPPVIETPIEAGPRVMEHVNSNPVLYATNGFRTDGVAASDFVRVARVAAYAEYWRPQSDQH